MVVGQGSIKDWIEDEEGREIMACVCGEMDVAPDEPD